MSFGNWLSNAPTGVVSTRFWVAATVLIGLLASCEATIRVFGFNDYEAEEVQCRRDYQRDEAKLIAARRNQPESGAKGNGDPEKDAREYCIQRRSAVASERQGDIARWAAGVSFLALAAAGAAAWAAFGTVRTMRETSKRAARLHKSGLGNLHRHRR